MSDFERTDVAAAEAGERRRLMALRLGGELGEKPVSTN
jgi:hypothetical protein